MKTVFFVDDDGLLREMLARALEKENFRVTVFASPNDLLTALDSARPDVLISDLQMPGMHGLDMIESIGKRGLSFPIIVVSGHITPEIEERARGLGVCDVLAKPIKDFSRLSLVIDRALTQCRTAEADIDRRGLSLLTGLSHELRTPLTAIQIALDGLFAGHSGGVSASRQRLVDITKRNINRIINVIEGELDLLQRVLTAPGAENVRGLATPSNKGILIFKCEFRQEPRSESDRHAGEREFLKRCLSTLSEEDVVVRGQREGTYYLVLIEREDGHINDIIKALQAPLAGARDGKPFDAVLLEKLPPAVPQIEELLLDPEAAT